MKDDTGGIYFSIGMLAGALIAGFLVLAYSNGYEKGKADASTVQCLSEVPR